MPFYFVRLEIVYGLMMISPMSPRRLVLPRRLCVLCYKLYAEASECIYQKDT